MYLVINILQIHKILTKISKILTKLYHYVLINTYLYYENKR
jgi:hypothetical protein